LRTSSVLLARGVAQGALAVNAPVVNVPGGGNA
jgi:hypothetical protein